MRNFTKILCVVLSLMMIVSLAACSFTKQYSYKTDDTELPIGVYIYNLYSAYNQAQGFAQKSDLYDSEAGTYDGNKSFLKMEITDDDDVTATADEWIKDKADEQTRQILAIYHEFNELGCTIDEATEEGYRNQAKEYWDYGPYYQYYGEQYLNPYSEIFEPIGVSYDSFYIASFYTSAMQSEVFKALYEASGTEAVSVKIWQHSLMTIITLSNTSPLSITKPSNSTQPTKKATKPPKALTLRSPKKRFRRITTS